MSTGFGFAHAVYRETDGNPFFVSEILRHLSETGTIYKDAIGRWVADGSLGEDRIARQRPRGDRRRGFCDSGPTPGVCCRWRR